MSDINEIKNRLDAIERKIFGAPRIKRSHKKEIRLQCRDCGQYIVMFEKQRGCDWLIMNNPRAHLSFLNTRCTYGLNHDHPLEAVEVSF